MDKIRLYLIRSVREIFYLFRVSVFLPRCSCCQEILVDRKEIILCQVCRAEIIPYPGPVCIKCGKAVSAGQKTCGECLLNPPPFCRHVSFARYEGVLRELISLYKFKEIRPLKKILAGCLVTHVLSAFDESFDWIVPVPADRGRNREVNPILDICKILSRELHIGLLKNNLVKVKKTLPQVKLTQAQRLKNLDGAFSLKHPRLVKGRKILLVDDVYTTGTTIKKCTGQLKKAGARVVAITLARSV
jgi:ComF family protein